MRLAPERQRDAVSIFQESHCPVLVAPFLSQHFSMVQHSLRE
jgi:hypothetical protein